MRQISTGLDALIDPWKDLLPACLARGGHLSIRSAALARACNDKDRVVLAMAVGRGRNLVGTSREETRSPAHTNAHTIFCPAPATEMLLYYTDTPARLDDGRGRRKGTAPAR
jgi:hypothetical protein